MLDPRDKPKYFTSLAFSCTGDVITGDSNGNMFIWARGYNAVTKVASKLYTECSKRKEIKYCAIKQLRNTFQGLSKGSYQPQVPDI